MDEHRFEGFGPNPLDPYAPRQTHRVSAKRSETLKQRMRRHCPKSPGIYGMLNRKGCLIYVGKSKSLRTRLLSYFSPRNAEEKAGRIIQTTRTILWEKQSSEFAALLREQQLIRRWTPRWNVQEIPKRQRPVYLCLGKNPAPYFFIAAIPPNDVVASEGPFQGATRVNRAVDSLNSYFRLRDCSNKQPLYFSDQLQLFDMDYRPGCLRYEIGTCSGPCVGGCTRGQYDQQVSEAQSYLDGFNQLPLESVRDTMEKASQRQQFELAARMREDLRSLEYLNRKLQFLADARRKYTFLYAAGTGSDGVWYLIRQGEVVEAIRAPQCKAEYADTRRYIQRWRREITNPDDHQSASPYPYTLWLVANWYRKFPEELQRTFQPSDAGRLYRRLAKAG